MTCTRPQAESQKDPLTRGRRPHMTPSGHRSGRKSRSAAGPRCAIPFVPSTEVLGSETARVHHAARRRRGGVAARGGCAAVRPGATHRGAPPAMPICSKCSAMPARHSSGLCREQSYLPRHRRCKSSATIPLLKRAIVHEDWHKACVRKRNAGGYAGLVVAGVVVLTPDRSMKG